MNRRTSMVTSAAFVGMAVGAAAYMLTGGKNGKKLKNKTKRLRKNTGKALRQAGDFINNVSYMVQ